MRSKLSTPRFKGAPSRHVKRRATLLKQLWQAFAALRLQEKQ